MDQTLFETLLQASDSDGAIRSAAEQRLKELEAAPEYPVSLARLTVSQELAIPQRQLAAVTLKSFVKSNWSARHEENFQGREPSPECKQAVRELIIHGLADPESKIRVVSAYVVSTIAQDDFPEDWPNLFDILLTYLKSKDANSVHGALRVMLEMVRHTVSVNQLPQIGPLLLPELYTILTADTVYSFRTRGRAAYIFRKLLHMSSIMRDENKAVVDQLLPPILPQWMEAFHTILNHYVQGDPQKQVEEYGLKTEVIGCIGNVSSLFPKQFATYLPVLVEPIWTNFRVAKERYIAEAVSETEYEGDSFQDSDGNEIGMQNWLLHLFEILESICNKASLRAIILNNNGALLEELVYHSIGFAQITREQAELWQADLNQYVADDFEQTGTHSIRVEASNKLSSIADYFTEEFVPVLQRAVQRLLAEANAARASGNKDWWKIQEACLLIIGHASVGYTGMGLENFKVGFDLESLFQHVVLEAMGAQEYPFLLGRALIFASGVASQLPTDLANRCLAITVEALRSPNASIPVKVCALHALQKYCKGLDSQYLKPYQAAIFEGASTLLQDANEEESLMLILDSFNAAFNIDGDAAVQYEGTLTPIVLEIWKKYANDHIITSFVLDLFEDFSKSQQYFPALISRALPFLDQVLKAAADSPLVLASAIDLLTAMMKFGPSPLPDPFTEQLFPLVLEIGWNSTNNEVVQSTQECVKQYIMKDCDHISRWHDGNGKSGLDYVIHFVAKLLAPNGTEIEPLFIGDLIVILIKKAGNSIASVLPELLNAVLVRLKSTDSQPFIQTLVMVFANLIIHQQENLLQFLFDINIDGQSGLEILMTTWCDNFQNFSGYYSIKVSTIALSKMFLVNDPRLANITVKGNILPNPDGVIVTRSRARQNPERYTAVPIHAKIISLLTDELATSLASEQQANEETESVYDDDGEWEDVTDTADYALLSDMLNNLDADDDEENNPDLKDDPIYQTDMKAYLTDFFKNCSAHNVNHFMELCQHHLTDLEKETLSQVLGQ